ncbi:RICIN domain-containing protein [Streptomyces kaniharaensis]|uniref:RICIN domain-containing protein n=1 Tax=Streptomyces kaniharaensis TaxID=212423 RepID=A0A6N7KTG2_9ACTN|nr:RICIN domain-containing protein [Streptomyces kaniharaensis]MQS13627.1 RICIN domain-containing protein [Streptomyces kaniharaensis]
MAVRARIVAGALGAALLFSLGAPSAGAYQQTIPTTVTWGVAFDPKCLEIADWRTDNGAPARQWDCTGGASQQWNVQGVRTSGGTGSLVNAFSGKCLEIADWRTDNGAPARQWDCTGGANQSWIRTWVPAVGWQLVNAHSGKCLEIADWRTDNGAPARQWDCTGGDNQHWFPFAPGTVR